METVSMQLLPSLQEAQFVQQAKNLETSEGLDEASKGFEAVFLRQFLGQALKPLLHETPGSGAPGAGIYQGMVTDAIANNLAESGEFGFATILQLQLAEAVQSSSAAKLSTEEK
jgi:Rod binding domain-containing protein